MDIPIRVLFVEDNADDVELIRYELAKSKFKIEYRQVETEDDFLSSLNEQEWNLIISDYTMPHFNGLKAFSLLQSSGKDIPFFFVSGTLGEERAVEAMRAGANDYLLKGNLTRLPEAIRRELQAAHNRKEQRRAEELALKSQHRMESAIQASDAGIFEIDFTQNTVNFLNNRVLDILGSDVLSIITATDFFDWFFAQIHPEDIKLLRQKHDIFLAGQAEKLSHESRMRKGVDQWINLEIFMNIERRNRDGSIAEIAACLIDITEHRQLETQLRQAHKMEAVGRLAGGIAHDFNNLLTVMFSYSEIVLNGMAKSDPLRPHVQEILNAAQRAANLTGQLLAFSRRKPISPKTINPNNSIIEMCKMIQRLIGENITLVTDLADDVGSILIDPGNFEQVIVNMAVNGRDAMQNGGKLTIGTFNTTLQSPQLSPVGNVISTGNYVKIVISDTGTGISDELKQRIFEPFFTTKEVGHGTGLGLATCLGIITQAYGYIEVASEINAGTTFSIYLPQVTIQEESSTPKEPVIPLQGTERILVVEDEPLIRELITKALTKWGYEVHFAIDGEDGFRVFELLEGKIDLLISDVVMPKMGGKELVDRIKQIKPDQKVLLISGYTDSTFSQQGLTIDEESFLAKPFRFNEFVEKVRVLLNKK